MKSKVFAIILNFNGRDTLAECVRSVFSSDCPNLEIVVVDNASKDGSFEEARVLFPKIHFIGSTKNIGFAAGNNLGIRFALEKGADFVFLLNNDAFVDRNTIADLVRQAEKLEKPSILSPIIYRGRTPSKNIWFSSGQIDWARMRTKHIDRTEEFGNELAYDSEYVTGCAMLIPKEIFRTIGILDERYFLYYEDADFCVAAKKAGYDVKVYPKSMAYHLEKSEVANPRKIYWLVVSGILFFRKNTPKRLKPKMEIYLLLRKCKNYWDLRKKHLSEEKHMVHEAYRDARKAKNFHHNSQL